MEKKVCIMGTCRIANLAGVRWDQYINPFNAGGHSKVYDYYGVKIVTQPITYTTKVTDTRDALLYMRGWIYEDKDPNEDETFFNLFFRGLNRSAFTEKKLKKPGETVYGTDNHYSAYVFEINSLREILFATTKYGESYLYKNLPWNIDIGFHNTLPLEKDDFLMVSPSTERVLHLFQVLQYLCDDKPILIVGPYLLKTDHRQEETWGENDVLDPHQYVNHSRRNVQGMLKEAVSHFPSMEYFDMTELIFQHDEPLLLEQYHFNEYGQYLLTQRVLEFVDKHCR
jgi:hypothetical protein